MKQRKTVKFVPVASAELNCLSIEIDEYLHMSPGDELTVGCEYRPNTGETYVCNIEVVQDLGALSILRPMLWFAKWLLVWALVLAAVMMGFMLTEAALGMV